MATHPAGDKQQQKGQQWRYGTHAECSETTTDAARLQIDLSGELVLGGLTVTAARTGDWQITGRLSEEATFSGMGTVSRGVKAVGNNATNTIEFDGEATYTDVKIKTADKTVVGGTATYVLDSHFLHEGRRTIEKEATLTGEVTFSTTGATLVLDGERTYTISNTGVATRHAR